MSDKNKVVFIGTLFAWFIIVAFITWIFLAVGWYLLFLLWKKELLIPTNVQNTSIIIFLLLIWALIVLIFAIILEKKYCTEKKRKKVSFSQEKQISKLSKPEAQVLIKNESDITYDIFWRGDIFRKKKIKGSPEELLSQAKNYNLENLPREAASLARLIMNLKVSNKIKEAATYELIKALKSIGFKIEKE